MLPLLFTRNEQWHSHLSLNFYTSVSGCGCGFRFEQKYWRINGIGEKRHGSADLHTPIHPYQTTTSGDLTWIVAALKTTGSSAIP